MVGKTPQVREIVYNVLDDNGDRTVIAKGASTVDVGDTEQLFTRTSDIEVLSSNTFSNVSNLQSNVIELETFLSSISFPGGQGVYQPILSVLEQNHVSNAARVEILESIHTSNVANINGNFSNITVLQDDVNSNVTRIETLESIHVSNVANINGNFSNIFIVSNDLSDNVTRIEDLEANIALVTNFGDITGLQSNVTELRNRVGGATIRIGTLSGGSASGGPGNSANSAIAIGDNAGAHMGNRSIAIGGFSGFNTQPQQALQTERSIVISAQSDPLRATRTDTLVISPMIEDNSNTIQMMGYNLTSNELVNTSLLKLLSDSNIHSTTNVYISNETVDGTTKIDIDGNGSFGGNIDINATLDVGGASSFGGAMTLNNNLETIGTSSFGGKMQVNNDIDCNGESFIMKNGFANKIIFREDGTGSFLSKVEVDASGNSTTASPAFEVAGASVFKSDVKIGDAGTDNLEVVGTSSFGGDMKVNNDLVMTNGSFTMNDGSTDLIKLQISGESSFSGQMETSGIDATSGTVDIYHSSAELRVGTGSSDFKASINQDGQGSFKNLIASDDTKTTVASPALKVEGRTLLNKGLSVSSTAASSFAGTCSFGGISSFGGDMKVNNDLVMTNGSFTMNNGSTDRIKLQTSGASSFAGLMTSGGIDVTSGTVDIYHSSAALRVGTGINDLNIGLNANGTSSFFGVMEVNNNIVCDGIVAVRSGGHDRIMLTPDGSNNSQLKVLGDIETYNGTIKKTEIDSNGNGSFSGTVTGAAFAGGGVSSTANGTVVKRDNSGNFAAGTITASMSTSLTPGTDIDGSAYNGGTARTFAVISSTTANGKIVKRDASGNFSAGTITAYLVGNISGNSATTSEGTSANHASALVRRDGNGDFSARNITGYLYGSINGNSATTSEGTSANTAYALVRRNNLGSADFNSIGGNVTGGYYINISGYRNEMPYGNNVEFWKVDLGSGYFEHGEQGFTDDDSGGPYLGIGIKSEYSIHSKAQLFVTSDKRIKTNIRSMDTDVCLEHVNNLNPVSFNKISPNGNFTPQIGFIAQEVENNLPTSVMTNVATLPNILLYGTLSNRVYIDVVEDDGEKHEAIKFDLTVKNGNLNHLTDKETIKIGIEGKNCDFLYDKSICGDIQNNGTSLSVCLPKHKEEEIPDKDIFDDVWIEGTQVNDVKSLDYNQIFCVLMGAVKEIDKQRKQDKIGFESQLSQLMSRIEALEGS